MAAGKSTLLYGLLGEATRVHGSLELRGGGGGGGGGGSAAELRPVVSWVGQTPWLLSASIRENICQA